MKVVVVGAGIAGLVAALELSRRGVDVTVVERAETPGGKLRTLPVAGREIDGGPTVFTMRWVFDALFDDVGLDFGSHVGLHPVSVLARHAWQDGSTLDLHADIAHSADAIAAFAGPAEARGYRDFAATAARLYDALWPTFIAASRPTAVTLVGRIARHDPRGLSIINPGTTLWTALGRFFRDPRLRQLFGRYATYCGSSPFAAPSILMLVAHVEQRGVWTIDGGMAALARALAKIAGSSGARFLYGTHVTRIETEGRGVSAVHTARGERIPSDAIILNADANAVAARFFGHEVARAVPPVPGHARSLSALTWATVARPQGFPLARHNVFFSDDYPSEFADIFRKQRIPDTPTVYVCAQDRDDAVATPSTDGERLLCLVNAPAIGDRNPSVFAPAEIDRCQARMATMLQKCGLALDMTPDSTTVTTPSGFEALFPATGGALYGRNAHGWTASFQRPGARTSIPGLYLAGGSVHPGPGVPMAALSGRTAVATLLADRASTSPFRRAAMRGGMSMR